MIVRSLLAASLCVTAFAAQAEDLFNTQTYKCFTDDFEPGRYIQVTFGSDGAGALRVSDLRSYGETVHSGEIYGLKTYTDNAASFGVSGVYAFAGANGEGRVALRISPIDTPIKWQLMSGTVNFGDRADLPVTCAYIGVKGPR